jgi:hypothetical protein
MIRVFGAIPALLAGPGASTLEAGFRSPDSLVRNVYAYCGDRFDKTHVAVAFDNTAARSH